MKNDHMDLANSVSDPQVEVGLLDDVNQRALRVSPGHRHHGVIGPQHRHLQTTTTQFKTLTLQIILKEEIKCVVIIIQFIFIKIFLIISVSQEYDQCAIIQQLPDIRPYIGAVSLCWWQQIIKYKMT